PRSGDQCPAGRAGRADGGVAGRGAAAEIAMARRLAVRTVESQLGYGTVLVDDFPHLLQACWDGRVCQAAARSIVEACETLTGEQRRSIDPELTVRVLELTPGAGREGRPRPHACVDDGAWGWDCHAVGALAGRAGG